MLLLNASGLCVFSNNFHCIKINAACAVPGLRALPNILDAPTPRIIVTHISSPSGANQRWGHAPWAWSCPCGWKRGVA